jgi:hypothetical protein
MSRAKDIKEPNNLKNLHQKKNSNLVNLSPVNIRKSENFKPVNINNLINKDKDKETEKDNFGKEAELDTEKLKKRLAEIEYIMNKIDNNQKQIFNLPENVKKENKIKNNKINEKSKGNNNNIKKLDINENLKINSEKNLLILDKYDRLSKKEVKNTEYRQTTDSSKYYVITKDKEGDDYYNNYKQTDLLAEFSENYKTVSDIPIENSVLNTQQKLDVIESSKLYFVLVFQFSMLFI